ncbi:MAG TPA: glycerol-3-phosphate dehydrogenase/oxidase [Acidimicrobiales bacterium]|nr:glycerol-3-phosphate dehydrogenase/oxidase [Acidimicrobiales bacterium]
MSDGNAEEASSPGLPSGLSPGRRAADIAKLTSGQLDLLIVGGGVVGAGCALDAITRGLSVGLVEAEDWASGTSSRSTKLVHGGLRYLQMLDFRLVHEALRERDLLLGHLAPHLVHPVPVLYPLRRVALERAYVGLGVGLYDVLGRSMRHSRRLPRHKHLSKDGALRVAPGLRAQALVGAVEYYDGQVDDARFTLELVRTAVSRGAVAQNRLKVVGFVRERGRVVGAIVADRETSQEHEVRAKVVVLATGAWTEETEALAGEERGALVRPSKGVHLVLPKSSIRSSVGLILRTEKSVLFALPWGEHWVVGTTDTDWPYDKGQPLATGADIEYLLSELNSVLEHPVQRADVEAVYAGLRPLVAGVGVVRGPGEMGPLDELPKLKAPSKISREHAVSSPLPGLVVVSGGKLTTYRVMAAGTVDAAVASAGLGDAPKSRTGSEPLLGARGFCALWQQRHALSRSERVDLPTLERLLRRYGGLVTELLEIMKVDESLAAPLEGAEGYLRAEVVYAVTHEGARHIDDVLIRRTRAAMESRRLALASAPAAADLLAPLLGWDSVTKQAELDAYRQRAELEMAASLAETDEEAAALLAGARARQVHW